MNLETLRSSGIVVLGPDDFMVLGREQFGVEGLQAVESIGPFVEVQASGPLIMVHDGRFEPHRGIGHHPHRFNERLFYILEGAVDHDDALNRITGYMGTGDLGRLTEGRRGMIHKEWNKTDGPARAFILVYGTDPMPPEASFAALRDEDAPRYLEGPGVQTKELVGDRSPLEIHGDIRLFTDSRLEPGASLRIEVGESEGALLIPIEGDVEVEGSPVPTGHIALIPPGREARQIALDSPAGARLLRVVHGPGDGLVVRDDLGPTSA